MLFLRIEMETLSLRFFQFVCLNTFEVLSTRATSVQGLKFSRNAVTMRCMLL